MGDPFNRAPGNKQQEEKQDKKAILLWEWALHIARMEARATEYKTRFPDMYASEKAKIKQIRKKMPGIGEKILGKARTFELSDSLRERRKTLSESPLGNLKSELEERYLKELEEEGAEDEGGGEAFQASAEEIIKKFFGCLIEKEMLEEKHNVSITKELLDVIDLIYYEIEHCDFRLTRDTERGKERRAHIENLEGLNLFIDLLKAWLRRHGTTKLISKDESGDFSKKVIHSLDNSPVELATNLLWAFYEIRADLQVRDFSALPEAPEDVQNAYRRKHFAKVSEIY